MFQFLMKVYMKEGKEFWRLNILQPISGCKIFNLQHASNSHARNLKEYYKVFSEVRHRLDDRQFRTPLSNKCIQGFG